jgi:CHAT domain-containing protein
MLPQVGEVLINYAMTRRLEGEYRQATALLEQAEAIWQTLNNHRWLIQIYFERILLALERGEYKRAAALLETPPPLAGNASLAAEFQLLQVETLRLVGVTTDQTRQSQQQYAEICHYAKEQNLRWLQRRGLLGLGKLLLVADPEQAIQCFEEAASLDETIRQTLNVEELKASFHEQAHDLFDELIRCALTRQEPAKVLSYVWRAKAGALLDLLQTMQGEITLAPEERRALETVRQRLATSRWEQAIQQRSELLLPDNESTNAEIVQLEQQLLHLRQQQNHARRSPMPAAAHSNPQAILAAMDADILLEYMPCGDELVGIYADRLGNCKALVLGDLSEFADLSARIQLRFGNVVARPMREQQKYAEIWRQEALPLLASCYQRLLLPLLAYAPETKRTPSLLIAPCDPLFLLPFAAFWDGAHYVQEKYTLEMILSGALLSTTPTTNSLYSPPVIIAAASGAMTAVRQEAQAVALALDHSVSFIDTQALAYVRQLTLPPRLVHIAAHSLIRADAPLFSALQLTGEILAVEQCYELPLTGTELVTLSGCTTAGGLESDGSLLAFQSALLIAGARRVLCSLWPVSDEATVLWMSHFYAFLSRGHTIPHAVQQVQQLLSSDPIYKHPAIWAAFASTRR